MSSDITNTAGEPDTRTERTRSSARKVERNPCRKFTAEEIKNTCDF